MEEENSKPKRFSDKLPKLLKIGGGVVIALLMAGIFYTPNKSAPVQEEEKPQNSSDTPRPRSFNHVTPSLEVSEVEKEPDPEIEKENVNAQQSSSSDNESSNKEQEDKPPMFRSGLGDPRNEVAVRESSVSVQEQWQIDTLNQIKQKRRQAFLDALQSPIAVSGMQTVNSENGVSNGLGNYDVNSQSGIAAEQDRVRQEIARAEAQIASLNGRGGSGGSTSTTVLDVSDYHGEETNSRGVGNAYGDYAKRDGWSLNSKLMAAKPFTVNAGTVLPAVMITGINSDLPGQIMGQVSQNVYDTASGFNLLIPQGTRIVGTYASNVTYGQERVMVAWQRLIYPDGRTLDLGAMPGSDQSGYSGFTDQVDNHWWKLISSAFLMSGIVATVAVSVDTKNKSNNNNSNSTNMSDTLRTSLASQFGSVVSQVIQRNLNVSPTLEIRPGYQFNVVVTKDITFDKAYEF